MYPDIMLNIMVSDQMMDFSSGKVDVVLRAEENPKPSLWGHRIAQLNTKFYAHSDLLGKYGGNSSQATQAEGIPLIIHDGIVASSETETLERFPNGRIALRADSLETSATFVQRGLGVARLPEIVGNSMASVEAVNGLSSPTHRSLWILTHQDLRNVERIRRFIDFVAEKTPDINAPAENSDED